MMDNSSSSSPLPSSETLPIAVSQSPSQDAKKADSPWRFGNVSIFCAWAASSLSGDNEKRAASAAQVDTTSASENSQPDAAQARSVENTPYSIIATDVPLTVWGAKRISAVPKQERGMFTLAELRIIIARLITVTRDKVAPKGVPLYYVLYIGTVEKKLPRLSWLRPRRRSNQPIGATGGLAGRPALDNETFARIVDMLDEIRTEMGLVRTTEHPESTDTGTETPILDAAYYEHYSPSRRGRGYLVLDPLFSLVVDCAEEDVRSLLTTVQQAHLTHHGLAASSYATIVMRISLWDANSDVHASLDDLAQVNRSSSASTQGQILLSFTLAGIGTLLALSPLLGGRAGQLVAPMLIYALAAIVHALFALTGREIFNRLGFLCLVLATVLAIVIFAVPSFVIPFLPSR